MSPDGAQLFLSRCFQSGSRPGGGAGDGTAGAGAGGREVAGGGGGFFGGRSVAASGVKGVGDTSPIAGAMAATEASASSTCSLGGGGSARKWSRSRRTHVPRRQSKPGEQSMSSVQVPAARLLQDMARIAARASRASRTATFEGWFGRAIITFRRTSGDQDQRSGCSGGCTGIPVRIRCSPPAPDRSPGRFRRCWPRRPSLPGNPGWSRTSPCNSRRGTGHRPRNAGRSHRPSCSAPPPSDSSGRHHRCRNPNEPRPSPRTAGTAGPRPPPGSGDEVR
jgi:hypothetical protein